MSKVFRRYKGGDDTIQGWSNSPAFPYDSTARDTIEDPDGEKATHEITSIPSPFARIDLVKTAFKEVNKLAGKNLDNLDGNSIFHKMVSDSLDVGEIFFNIDKYKDKVEIITWDVSQAIEALSKDGDTGHRILADSLDKYLKSDDKTYNFSKLKNVYLLNYIGGEDELNIIGATSPATLFFSGANNLNYVEGIYFANNDKPFDSAFQPLYKRDFEYIKSWWTLRQTIGNFSTLFPEIEEYLRLTYKAITNQELKSKLKIGPAYVNDFSYIDVQSGQQTNQVEVLGIELFKRKQGVNGEIEFTINTERIGDSPLPLVLPVESGNKYADLKYVNGKWGNKNKAPYKDNETNVKSRKLPFDGSEYPYLTISDFLEDTIVGVPHTLNKKYFFDGNIKGDEKMSSFLLPIKPLYFEYFSADILKSEMADGNPAFEMEVVAGGSVNVVIRIPIKGNNSIKYIEYQRLYYAKRQADVSDVKDEGGMVSFDFTGLVMPGKNFKDENKALYKVSCVSTFSSHIKFDFHKNGSQIHDIPVDCRNTNGTHDYKAETYTIQGTNFDFVRVSDIKGLGNVIVPTFPPKDNGENKGNGERKDNGERFEFAVDLGTTNTHIEFKEVNETNSKPFNFNESEPIYCKFFETSYKEIQGKLYPIDLKDENDLIAADFVPSIVGKTSDFQFPTRTVLSYAKSIDWTKEPRVFGLLNFSLTYNKRSQLPYNDIPMVNIKWSNDPTAQTAMQSYIDNVMLLIRNKVIANNGNLEETRITWFYPNSMSPRRLSQLRESWNDSYHKFFNTTGNTRSVSESVAPIRCYYNTERLTETLVSVDIGGGTTDIAFSSEGNVDYITSFKLAANSLFDDAFAPLNQDNGIVDWFKAGIKEVLDSKEELNELANVFNNNIGQPSNMASFLFSLKDNSVTKDLAKNKIDFNIILQNDTKFKIVFILFYVAIIYHIAQIVKVKGLKTPRHIAFSGNGSKIINIITSDTKILSEFTKIIFEEVLEKTYDTKLDVIGLEKESNPKESTCKGGLVNINDCGDEPTQLVLKDSSGLLAESSDTYAKIDDSAKDSIVSSVSEFFRFALEKLPSKINFDDNFGVDAVTLKIALDVCKYDLDTYLNKGIVLAIKESGNPDNKIEDALTFYPIKGVLLELSTRIYEYYKENNN